MILSLKGGAHLAQTGKMLLPRGLGRRRRAKQGASRCNRLVRVRKITFRSDAKALSDMVADQGSGEDAGDEYEGHGISFQVEREAPCRLKRDALVGNMVFPKGWMK